MEYIKLKEVCDLKNGFAFKSSDYIESSNVLNCRMSNIRPNATFDAEYNPKYLPEEFCEKYEEYLLNDGDLIIAMTDLANDPKLVGVPTIVDTKGYKMLLNQRVGKLILLDKNRVIEPYLKYALSLPQHKNYFKKFAGGGLQINIGKQEILNLEIPYCEVKTQKKIVEVLDKAQELIDKRKEQIEALDELVKSRFIEMFGDNNTIFKKWKNTIIDEVSEVGVGVVIKPSEYYTEENNGIKTFRSLNIGEMYVKDKDWVYFTKEGNDKNKKSILKEGQVLIVRSGYPGTACVVTKDYEGCNAIDVIIATPDNKNINSTYMCAFTNFPHGKNQIVSGQAGAGQKHFNVGAYKKLKIALPPIELQNKFEEFVKQVDKLKSQMETSLKELEDNFNSLMQKAFKGELF